MSATQTAATPEDLDAGMRLVLPGKVCPAGAGWTWIQGGWRLFLRAPIMWFIALVILFVLGVVMSLVPIIGTLIYHAFTAVLSAGLVVACRSLEKGGEFELEQLFAGFKSPRFVNLVVVGLLFVLGGIAIVFVFLAIVGFTLVGVFMSGNIQDILGALLASSVVLLLGLLVALALSVPLLAAYWFAPALVIMHGVAPLAAMKESLVACIRNFVPFLVYSLIGLLALIVICIPAIVPIIGWLASFVGFVVAFIVTITSTYVAYRQIFTEDAAPAAAAPPRATMA
ncbi:MAG: BPSS1780 family membrane protein [Usitatibacter sp.]